MSIAIFSPYGLASEESGILALLANYLQQSNYAVTSLSCNGALSLCDRDAESGWRRGVRHCFGCMREQNAISRWAGISSHELSRYLTPEDVSSSKRWALGVNERSYRHVRFDNVEIFPLVRQSFFARTGTDDSDHATPEHLEMLRRLMVWSTRTYSAARKFLSVNSIKLVLVAGAQDALTASFAQAAKDSEIGIAEFRWDMLTRAVQVSHPAAARSYSCPLVFEDVTTMRTDSRTWPGEIVRIVDELMVFLEISTSQMALPLAQ